MPTTDDKFLVNLAYHLNVGPWLAEHGTTWAGRELPREYAVLPSEPQQCFSNVARANLSESAEGLRPAEGLAGPGPTIAHAWLIDHAGNVVDPTPTGWGARATYIGAIIPQALYLRLVVRDGLIGFPVLADLIQAGWTPDASEAQVEAVCASLDAMLWPEDAEEGR